MMDYLEAGLIGASAAAARVFKIRKATVPGVVLSIGTAYAQYRLKLIETRGYVERYRIDEIRRLHLATKGLSTYQMVAVKR